MADDLSLLFRLKAENSQAKSTLSDTQAAVAKLKQSAGADFSEISKISKQEFDKVGDDLKNFATSNVPIIGSALGRIIGSFSNLGEESKKQKSEVDKLSKSISDIGQSTGKSSADITSFLTKFVQIEGQANRDTAAIEKFGAANAQTLIPTLEAAGKQLGAVSEGSAAAAGSIAEIAGPIGIVVVANLALVAAVALSIKSFIDLSVSSAELTGHLFDLSQQTGFSVETLSALGTLAETTGSSLDGLTASLGIFQRNLESAGDPTSKLGKAFRELGVDATNTEDAFRQALIGLAKLPEGYKQTAAALEIFGRGGKSVLAIVKESNGDLDGAIARLKALGIVISTESAKSADQFNDSLTELNKQWTALGIELTSASIPALKEVVKSASDFVANNRDLISELGKLIGAFASLAAKLVQAHLAVVQLEKSLGSAFGSNIDAIVPGLSIVAGLFERAAAAAGFVAANPIKPVDIPKTADSGGALADPLLSRLLPATNAQLEDQKRAATDALNQAKRDFEAGKITREEELNSIIKNNTAKISAEIKQLQEERSLKTAEYQLLQLSEASVADQRKASSELIDIDTKVKDKQAEIRNIVATERAKFRKEELEKEVASQNRQLENADKIDAIKIEQIRRSATSEATARIAAEKQIQEIQLTGISRKESQLVKEAELAGKDLAKRKEINDKIAALETEKRNIVAISGAAQVTLLENEVALLNSIIQSKYTRQIASIKALEDSRVITSEQAAEKALEVQLKANEAEIDAAIDANKDFRLLLEQRDAIIEEGNRNIEKGRQDDLANEKNYYSELGKIQRETAQIVIELMVLNRERRTDIITVQANLERKDENDRHKRETDRLKAIKADNAATEAEEARHLKAIEKIDKQEKADKTKDKLNPESQFDLLGKQFENLTGDKLTLATAGIDAMKTAFTELGQAVGQAVQAFVLYGAAGTSVRKVTAEIIAAIAQQAAIKAIFELAEGFAALARAFFGDPKAAAEATLHFQSAAIYGSLAAVAAVAGRAVAGDSFKQTSTGAGSGGASGGSSSGGGSTKPIDIGRRQGASASPVIQVHLHGDIADDKIVNVVVKNQLRGGKIHQLNSSNGVLVQ